MGHPVEGVEGQAGGRGKQLEAKARALQLEIVKPAVSFEVVQESFILIRGGSIHRQASRNSATPPAFWTTTCGVRFAGSNFLFLSSMEPAQSGGKWCSKCVGPARAAEGQLGIYGPELGPYVAHRAEVALTLNVVSFNSAAANIV